MCLHCFFILNMLHFSCLWFSEAFSSLFLFDFTFSLGRTTPLVKESFCIRAMYYLIFSGNSKRSAILKIRKPLCFDELFLYHTILLFFFFFSITFKQECTNKSLILWILCKRKKVTNITQTLKFNLDITRNEEIIFFLTLLLMSKCWNISVWVWILLSYP